MGSWALFLADASRGLGEVVIKKRVEAMTKKSDSRVLMLIKTPLRIVGNTWTGSVAVILTLIYRNGEVFSEGSGIRQALCLRQLVSRV